MKRESLLYVAFILIIVIYCEMLLLKIMVVFLSAFFYFYRYRNGVVLYLIFLLGFILLSQSNDSMSTQTIWKIDEIRSNYVIASSRKEKCLLFNVENVALQEIIEVKGKFEKIYSNQNADTFSFKKYMNRKGIYYSMFVTQYEKKNDSNSIKARLYRKINRVENKNIKEYLNKVFYRINEEREDNDYFIYASGVHLVFIIGCIAKLCKIDKNKIAIVISVFFFIGFPKTFYVMRIFFFALIPLLFRSYHKKEQLGLSMITLLFYDPSAIYTISFILPVLFRLMYLFDIRRISNKLKQILILFPVQLFYFHECNLFEVLLFPLFRFLNSICFLFAFFTIFFSSFYSILEVLINLQKYVINMCENAFTIIGKPSVLWLAFWIIMVVFLISKYQKRYLIFFPLLILIQMNMKLLNPFNEVMFLDVGQGDCILVREKFNGEVMLIDVAGSLNKDIAKTIIYPVLKSKGIKRINKIVITHDDYDHSGGLTSLKNLIVVDEIIKKKQTIQLDNIQFQSISASTAYGDANDDSIVLFAQINRMNYLFMADVSKKVELEILERYNRLKVDVLKVGHHGSNSSSDAYFIHQVHPLVALISSGKNNRYNHPHPDVMNTFEKDKAYILDTKEVGSVSILSLMNYHFLMSANNQISIIKK